MPVWEGILCVQDSLLFSVSLGAAGLREQVGRAALASPTSNRAMGAPEAMFYLDRCCTVWFRGVVH